MQQLDQGIDRYLSLMEFCHYAGRGPEDRSHERSNVSLLFLCRQVRMERRGFGQLSIGVRQHTDGECAVQAARIG